MRKLIILLAVLLFLVACLLVLYFYLRRRAEGLPADGPAACAVSADGRPAVLFLGDSLTAGSVSANFVNLVGARRADLRAVNGGINAELAYNAHRRLREALELCAPAYAVVLLGTNDLNATVSERKEREYLAEMRLPEKPTREFFARNLAAILADLARAGVRTAVFSIPPIGEELDLPVNRRAVEYNALVRDLAARHGATYLGLFEAMREYLQGKPIASGCRDGEYPITSSVMQRFLLFRDWDEISRGRGFHLTTDCLHLNDTAAAMAADLIVQWLGSVRPGG